MLKYVNVAVVNLNLLQYLIDYVMIASKDCLFDIDIKNIII